MAKLQKYSEDMLLSAVIKYSEIEKKKIKATELAKWCRNNVEGLEEVRDYHFTRPVKAKDEKTGKTVIREKLCTLKIEEINRIRSLTAGVNTNLLLNASNIDIFLTQTDSAKRKIIVETREMVDKLLNRNRNITKENEILLFENKSLKLDIEKMSEKISAFQKKQSKLDRQVAYLMKAVDEAVCKEMLSQMGIEDGSIDLVTYKNSLHQELSDIMNINKSLYKHNSELECQFDDEENKNLTSTIMAGLDD